jgi:hypothetical protein
LSFFDDVLAEGKKALSSLKDKSTVFPNDGTGKPSVPWSRLNQGEVFFKAPEIKGENWNRFFPYRLMVIDINTNKPISSGGGVPKEIQSQEVEGRTTITVQPMGNQWVYTFPISPSKLSISTPFAIRTTATSQGILEEHNGVKFKMISIAGTTGVWPNRPNITAPAKSATIAQTLLSNTFRNLSRIADSVNRIRNIAGGDHPANSPNSPKPQGALLEQTGYYQAELLEKFLEQYAIAKKDPKNKHWRLVLDMPKKNEAYVVTPIVALFDKNKERPTENFYTLQLKAWKRVNLKQKVEFVDPKPVQITANTLQRIYQSINQARILVGNSLDLIKAVRSDFQRPLNALRQAALFVKDSVGLAVSAADLPRQIVDDFSSSIKGSLSILEDAVEDLENLLPSGGFSALRQSRQNNEGLSENQVKSGALGQERINYNDSDPANNIFKDPERYHEFFESLDTGLMNLDQDQQDIIDNEIDTVRAFTVDDFRQIKETIKDLAQGISNRYGAVPQEYADLYDLPTPRERVGEMTIEENEILEALYEVIQGLDYLTANKFLNKQQTQSPLEYVGGLADESGIAFELSNSKYLVPVPFNKTIEEISKRYLGDPNRWIEIATLNNLKSPYIDEQGFSRDLLSNGDGRQFNIESNDELYVGQKITLSSNTVSKFMRKIQNIEKIDDTNYLITVDGLDNLSVLKIAQGAKMTAFLPGTVNSQNMIYIPSELPSNESGQEETFSIPYLEEDELTGLSKIDWLLTETGDLALDATGDFRLANGLNNIIQAIRQKIVTKKGALFAHPNYGLGIQPGISHADILAGDIFDDLRDMIQQDPRFSAVERLVLEIDGPKLAIKVDISLSGNRGLLPISFDVPV